MESKTYNLWHKIPEGNWSCRCIVLMYFHLNANWYVGTLCLRESPIQTVFLMYLMYSKLREIVDGGNPSVGSCQWKFSMKFWHVLQKFWQKLKLKNI